MAQLINSEVKIDYLCLPSKFMLFITTLSKGKEVCGIWMPWNFLPFLRSKSNFINSGLDLGEWGNPDGPPYLLKTFTFCIAMKSFFLKLSLEESSKNSWERGRKVASWRCVPTLFQEQEGRGFMPTSWHLNFFTSG